LSNGMDGKKIFGPEDFADCSSRKTLLMVDRKGWIVAVLVRQPEDPEWAYVIADATKVMRGIQQLGAAMDLFSEKSLNHRQGEIFTIPVGVSFGGGQTVEASQKNTTTCLVTI